MNLARRLARGRVGFRALRRGQRFVTSRQPQLPISPDSTFVICTNPRSGSWLLSEGLGATGLAGNPREWFNPIEQEGHRASWHLRHSGDPDEAQSLALARAESTSPNGLCGVKLMYDQLAALPAKIEALGGPAGLDPVQAMMTLFPDRRFIWLSRKDKSRQAVSLSIATATAQWWSIEGIARDAAVSGRCEPTFDPYAITRLEQVLRANDTGWRDFFAAHGIVPKVVHYEELLADYRGTIVSILDWLGIAEPHKVRIPPSRLKRQSNDRNEDWLERYRSFKRGVESSDPDTIRHDKLASRKSRDANMRPLP